MNKKWSKTEKRKEIRSRAFDRLRVALDAAGIGAWDWTIPEGTVHWSETLERLHGLEPGTFPGTLDAFRADIHPEDLESVLRTIDSVLDQPGAEYGVEYRIIRPDGEVRWLSASGAVLRNDSGAPVRMIGVCTDITRRKKEEAVDRLLARASKALAGSLDLDQTIRRVSELAVPEVADWCAVDLLEKGQIRRAAVSHTDPELRSLVEEFSRRSPPHLHAEVGSGAVIRTGKPQLVRKFSEKVAGASDHVHKASRLLELVRPRSAIFVPLEAGGERLGALALAQSHSGRRFEEDDLALAGEIASRAASAIENARLYREVRNTAAALELERSQLRELFQQAPAFIAVLRGPDHVFEVVNPLYYDLVGHRQLLGKPVREALPEVEGQGYFDVLDQVYRTGHPYAASGARVQVRRGEEPGPLEEVYLNFVYQPLFEKDGSVSGIFTHGVDVTELVQARQSAEAAVASRDEMLAFVSHDLRNCLGVVELGTRTVMEIPLEKEEHREILQRVLATSRRALRFIDDLLDVTRGEMGHFTLRLETVSPEEILRTAADGFRDWARTDCIELRIEGDERLPPLRADPHRLHRVFSNLLKNALKHAGKGGSVRLGAREEPGKIVFWVSDTGPGIPPEVHEHIFERYWKGEDSEGIGLGLAIARMIVEAHGGRIRVESEVGRGSSFLLHIPLAER